MRIVRNMSFFTAFFLIGVMFMYGIKSMHYTASNITDVSFLRDVSSLGFTWTRNAIDWITETGGILDKLLNFIRFIFSQIQKFIDLFKNAFSVFQKLDKVSSFGGGGGSYGGR